MKGEMISGEEQGGEDDAVSVCSQCMLLSHQLPLICSGTVCRMITLLRVACTVRTRRL